MTHLLPGSSVSRVHGARSPVPPRLRHFGTPRSVCYLATMAVGACPTRCLPNAWSPGLLAPPGLCYWLVASGTPTGWRGGYLAAELVRSTVCHYCFCGCSALVLCARCSLQVGGLGSSVGPPVSPLPPALPSAPRGVCGGLSCPGVPSPRLLVRHSMRSVGFRGLAQVALKVRAVCPLRVCALMLPRLSHPPPPERLGARTMRVSGWGRC